MDDYVREEMATREAVAIGLDRDDTIIRRRLRQKLEFLAADSVDSVPPTDAELQTWLTEHPDAFRTEAGSGVPAGLPEPGATRRIDRGRRPPAPRAIVRGRPRRRRCGARRLPDAAARSRALDSQRRRPSVRRRVRRRDHEGDAGPLGRPPDVRLRPAPRVRARARRGAHAHARRRPPAGRTRIHECAPDTRARLDVRAHAPTLPSDGGEARPGNRRRQVRRRHPRGEPRGERREAGCHRRSRAGDAWSRRVHRGCARVAARLSRAPRDRARRPTASSGRSRPAARSRSTSRRSCPTECRLATAGQQQLTPGALIVRGTLTCEGGIEGKTHRDRRARIHDYRRHRPPASRRRPPRKPRAQAHQPHRSRSAHGPRAGSVRRATSVSASSTSCSASTTCSSSSACC